VREATQVSLEEKRREKLVGSSLEAAITIEANPERHALLKQYESDLPSIFIVSGVELKEVHNLPLAPDFRVLVSRSKWKKCERCWNYRSAVGSFKDHQTLCDRCVEAVQ
jgi:isoleucyl-tRNA synthetase